MEKSNKQQQNAWDDSGRISLPILKHDIDRRILKITAMINRKNSNHQNSMRSELKSACKSGTMYKEAQTQTLQDSSPSIRWMDAQKGILSPSKQLDINVKAQKFKLNVFRNGRQMTNNTKQSNRPEQEFVKRDDSIIEDSKENNKILIESNGFTFRAKNVENSIYSEDYEQSTKEQDQKRFYRIDFANGIPTRSSLIVETYRTKTCSPFNHERSAERLSLWTDLSTSDLGRENSNRKHCLRRVRTSGIEEGRPRIITHPECMQRMLEEVSELIGKRRKEFVDKQVRQNVLRKIEDRYGLFDS